VDVDGVPTYRLDLAYPCAKVAIEYDGEEFHTSPGDRAADELRRDWLRAHGWVVIVVTRRDFMRDAQRFWPGEVARALAEAARRPLPQYTKRG
jgi:very-short-patch-repair endonuclease